VDFTETYINTVAILLYKWLQEDLEWHKDLEAGAAIEIKWVRVQSPE